jgi:hypothetical protein
MGAACYLCKYVAKFEGNKSISNCIVLVSEAYNKSQIRPSIAPDAAVNENREAIRIFTRIINNFTRYVKSM